MSEVSPLYRLKPVFEIPSNIDLPTCVYRLKNPVASVTNFVGESVEKDREILTSIMDKETEPEVAYLEAKWDEIITKLKTLKLEMVDIRRTISASCKLAGYTLLDTETLCNMKVLQGAVLNANPLNPPYSLLFIKHLYKCSVPIIFENYIHSSITNMPEHLKCFNQANNEHENNALRILIIWKNDVTDVELVANPLKHVPIKGEVNILRLLARLGLKLLQYPSDNIFKTTQVDAALDICHELLYSADEKSKCLLCKALSRKLGSMSYFGGDDVNIIDIAAWSILKQIIDKNSEMKKGISPSLLKWFEKMDSIFF